MSTALEQFVASDVKRNRARQYASMLIHELVNGGYIAGRYANEAEWHLADLFYRQDVEITTAEQRRIMQSA